MEKTLSIVGAGRVGSALARHAVRKGYRIDAVISRSADSARSLGAEVQSTSAGDWSEGIVPNGAILFSLPDREICAAAETLSRLSAPASAAFHTSGIRTSADLEPLRPSGTPIFSFHPIQTFYSREMSAANCEGIGVGIEGDAAAVGIARAIASDFGWRPILIPRDQKALYHAGCVFASNFVTVLASLSGDLISSASGLESPGTTVILPILRTAVAALAEAAPETVLTGPASRGDLETILLHCDALGSQGDEILGLYAALTRAAIRLARSGERIPTEIAEAMTNALSHYPDLP